MYLFCAIDSDGDMVEFWISERRNLAVAKHSLRKALKRHSRSERIVIDGRPTNREAILCGIWQTGCRTDHVDARPKLISEVLDIVRNPAAKGMTMALAIHEMGFAPELANRVCFLPEGIVYEEGPASQIFGNPQGEGTKAFHKRIIDVGRFRSPVSQAGAGDEANSQ